MSAMDKLNGRTASHKLKVDERDTLRSESLWTKALRRLRHDRLTLTALSILGLFVVLSLGAPLIGSLLQIDPVTPNTDVRLLPPGTPGHLPGTDHLGRDLLARLLYAGQISLAIGFFSAVIILLIGTALEMLTGYFGGIR